MFGVMMQKLKHKKWMVCCLLIGNVLLLSVAICYPMYRVASFQKMLTQEFKQYEEENGIWPATILIKDIAVKGSEATEFASFEEEFNKVNNELGISLAQTIVTKRVSSQKANALIVRDENVEKRMQITAFSNLYEKIDVFCGRLPSENISEDGKIEVIASEAAMIELDLLLNEEYEFSAFLDPNDVPYKICIVGFFRGIDDTDPYWVTNPNLLDKEVFVSMETWDSLFTREVVRETYSLYGSWYGLGDYEAIKIENVSSIINSLQEIDKKPTLEDKVEHEGYSTIFEEYVQKARKIEATFLIMQIPVYLLLCAFLYMISSQMLLMEQNEISVLKSRGASGKQILSLYFMQSFFLAGVAVLLSLPLGYLMCRFLGSSTAFLQFSMKDSLQVFYTNDIWPFMIAGVFISIGMMTMPVRKYSKVSIVHVKQKNGVKEKALWQKMYLDVVCLAISLYGYFSYQRTIDTVTKDILTGKSLDPLLYLCFSLFILGGGLFCCRLQPMLLKIIFKMFGKKMKPAAYTSILSTIRTGTKQQFIILFVILTVSIGISYTTMASTILSNAIDNKEYEIGADIVIKERWIENSVRDEEGNIELTGFIEPDYAKYQSIEGVQVVTKVLLEETEVIGGNASISTTLLGIKASEFAEVTNLRQGLLPFSYEDYLSIFAADKKALLVSENFMLKQGYKLGDTIVLLDEDNNRLSGKIFGFFSFWPGYEPYTYSLNEDDTLETIDNYYVVGNLSYIQSVEVRPYEVWMRVSDEGIGVQSFLASQVNIKITKFFNLEEETNAIKVDTLFRGTSGILSMSFLVILVLCCVGYLIYWILSIRSRELLFGVLRAMGMRQGEVNRMLLVEQTCSGLYAILAGTGIGLLAAHLFIPIIQQAYSVADQVLPLILVMNPIDLVEFFSVILVVVFICMIVLARIIKKLNISNALKLGED